MVPSLNGRQSQYIMFLFFYFLAFLFLGFVFCSVFCLCFVARTLRSHFFATGTVWLQDVELAERAGGIHVQPFVDAVAVKMVVTGKFS